MPHQFKLKSQIFSVGKSPLPTLTFLINLTHGGGEKLLPFFTLFKIEIKLYLFLVFHKFYMTSKSPLV